MTNGQRQHTLVEWLDRRWYPGVARNWDDELFRQAILGRLTRDSVVLDLGAGAGIVAQMNFRDCAARVHGVDPDERVLRNPYLHEARVGVAEQLPYTDGSFDLVFADNVFEHLSQPRTVLAEVARVLRPGGRLLAKTPNKWHYMPTIARSTPHAFHRFYNRMRGRDSDDTFPTRYLANSRSAITRLAAECGLEVVRIEHVESRPEYLRVHPVLYALGHAYERLVNRFEALAPFRILLLIELRKPGGETARA